MSSPTICAVSGVVRSTSGTGLSGVTVNGYCSRPFTHPTDGSAVLNYNVSTTTASDGSWTLNLIETTTPAITLTIAFFYPGGPNNYFRKEYTVTVPNTTTALFSSLITGEL